MICFITKATHIGYIDGKCYKKLKGIIPASLIFHSLGGGHTQTHTHTNMHQSNSYSTTYTYTKNYTYVRKTLHLRKLSFLYIRTIVFWVLKAYSFGTNLIHYE